MFEPTRALVGFADMVTLLGVQTILPPGGVVGVMVVTPSQLREALATTPLRYCEPPPIIMSTCTLPQENEEIFATVNGVTLLHTNGGDVEMGVVP